MKKYLSIILSLILALAMVFSLVACGGDDSGSDNDSDDSSKASSSDVSSDADSSSTSSKDDVSTSSVDSEPEDEEPVEDDEPVEDEKPVEDEEPADKTDDPFEGTWSGVGAVIIEGENVAVESEWTFEDGVVTLLSDGDTLEANYSFDDEKLEIDGYEYLYEFEDGVLYLYAADETEAHILTKD